MQKKQSIIRNANTMGMLLMNLEKRVFNVTSIEFERERLQTQEPRQRSDRKLNIDRLEVIVNHWEAFLHK
jgi:formylglycine-generating enzyme required for sulfatase activity